MPAVDMRADQVEPGDMIYVAGYRRVQRRGRPQYGKITLRFISGKVVLDRDLMVKVDTRWRDAPLANTIMEDDE